MRAGVCWLGAPTQRGRASGWQGSYLATHLLHNCAAAPPPRCPVLQKPANGWKSRADNTTGFFTSGRLLSADSAGSANGGAGARRLTRRLMGLLN